LSERLKKGIFFMSTEENKAIARRFVECRFTADLSILDELAAPNFTVSYPYFQYTHGKDTLEDLEEFKQAILRLHSQMSDLAAVSEDDVIAEGDKVVFRWTASGTLTQDIFGLVDGSSLIGKSIVWSGITIFQIVDGKVVAEIGQEDYWGPQRQLGIVPTGWTRNVVGGVGLP
jgi:predicted ester cyclase